MTIKFIDLFAGIGGFRYGLERANNNREFLQDPEAKKLQKDKPNVKKRQIGFNCVYSNEWDKYASQIYKKHYGECDTRDITTIPTTDIPDHDLLVGGFPCQAFSIAGKRAGFNDTRGTLFFEIARIAKDHQPMFMLLENVKGLISHNGGKTLEVILETLQQLGYYTNYEVHNSKNFGVPQNRERIFFLCTHIKSLLSVGQNKKITTSERIIQEWLFQILLNNLKEAQKVQGTESKDWVLGYLLCQEISRNPELKGENILDGITPHMGENTSLFQAGEVWQNIDTWLSKSSAGNLKELNKSTILTEIKKIIESRTYTYSQMFRAILLASVLLRKYSNPLWNEVLSSLILIQEDTKHERINNKAKKGIITESGTLHLTDNLQDFSKCFSLRHLRGEPRPKVFPFGESEGKNVSTEQKINQLNQPVHSNDRVYGKDGISPALNTAQGGRRQPKVYMLGEHRTELGKKTRREIRHKEGRDSTLRGKDHKEYRPTTVEEANCLTTGKENIEKWLIKDMKIRRLTPTECERLQGFPDGWTEGVSDTQRYKCLGNAVTTNVVTEIGKKFLNY